MTALIIAGGFATRLWPLTEKRSKALLPLAGKPLIDHLLEKIPDAMKVIISTNNVYKADFELLLKRFPQKLLSFHYEDSSHDKEKKGALAATAEVLERCDDDSPMAIFAGDNYFGFDFAAFIAAYHGRTLLACYDTKSLEAAKGFGVIAVEGNQVIAFEEKPENPKSTLISTGAYIFSPSDLPEIKSYSKISPDHFGGIFEHLLRKGRSIEVFRFDEPWFDIGSFDQYLKAQKILLKEKIIAEDCVIENTDFLSPVDIGKHCAIKNSVLDGVMILKNCHIEDCHLRNCIIDEGSDLRGVDLTHKMIRAGTNISAEVF